MKPKPLVNLPVVAFNHGFWPSNWRPVLDAGPEGIVWRHNKAYPRTTDIFIANKRVGWLEERPSYCDRGRYAFNTDLPGTDDHDSFPRYYMDRTRAVQEIEAWLRWRIWGLN